VRGGRRLLAVLAFSLAALAPAHAAERNDIPSCYAWAKLEAERPALSGRELVVIIDQTVHMNEPLQRSAWEHVIRYVRPGDSVRLYQFSAFLQEHYLSLQFAGLLEPPLEGRVRGRIGSNSLKQLDTCLNQQTGYFRQHFGRQFVASFGGAETDIARSEILFSLQKIGADIAARPMPERVVFLISDMLENSNITSFYRSGRVRDINPQAELDKARAFPADFAGARFYVHGAGLIGGQAAGSYRAGDTMLKLEQFWREYLTQSNASLHGFGTPELTVELR